MLSIQTLLEDIHTTLDDTYQPIPAGVYAALITSPKDGDFNTWFKEWSSKTKGTEGLRFLFRVQILDQKLAEAMGRKDIFLTQSIILNLNAGGKLDSQNNILLGQIFSAAEVEGSDFKALPGKAVTVTVTQTPRSDQPGVLQNNIVRVESVPF